MVLHNLNRINLGKTFHSYLMALLIGWSTFFCWYLTHPISALGQPKAVQNLKKQTKEKSEKPAEAKRLHQETESDRIPHLTEWKQVSLMADKLIDEQKFQEAEDLLNGVLPRAKNEAPTSLDYGLTLCRLSSALYALKNYPQALQRMNEAITVVAQVPPSEQQRHTMWRCLMSKGAILLSLKKNAESEVYSRKAIAYAIAFPDIAKPRQVRIAYAFLYKALEAQKKFAEAQKITEVMNSP